MPRVELPFANGFYVSESGPLIEKRAVNVYPVIPEGDAASQRVLFHTPGITQASSVVGANSRGGIVFSDGTLYRVIGNTLYSFDANGASTNHGTITGTNDVSMDSNGINIAIQDPAGDSYFFTPSTNTLETNNEVTFLSFGQATSVTFKDGYYIYTTDEVFFSSSVKTENDGKNFNALDFADAEISPDIIRKGFNDHNQLYILGATTTEVYRTIVTSGFPFQRIPGAMIPKGISAPNAIVSFDNSFVFLGAGANEKAAIYQALGSSINRISTKSIEQLIHGYSEETISNARAFSYSEDGNYFAVFTIGDHTFVYDQTNSKISQQKQWHERQTGITNGVGFKRCNVYTEYSNTIERFWSTKPFIELGAGIFSREIELYMETGLGNDDVAAPQIRMDYSDNGGRSFSNEISLPLGEVGEYNTRLRWKRLGRIPNSRVLRWKTTEPVPINVFGLFANAEVQPRG
jgi:hypothetical protein